jgi:hypothetical protein
MTYNPDTDYDRGAREFGERPHIIDDRGGSELVPEKDLPNALFRAGGVSFESDPLFDIEDDDAEYIDDIEDIEARLLAYAEVFDFDREHKFESAAHRARRLARGEGL